MCCHFQVIIFYNSQLTQVKKLIPNDGYSVKSDAQMDRKQYKTVIKQDLTINILIPGFL